MYLLRILFLLGFCQTLFAQELWMYPNQGQWDNRILYNMPLSSGRLYIENGGLTYFLSNATFHNHETKEAHEQLQPKIQAPITIIISSATTKTNGNPKYMA